MKNGMEMFKKIRNPMNLIEGSTNETNQTQETIRQEDNNEGVYYVENPAIIRKNVQIVGKVIRKVNI